MFPWKIRITDWSVNQFIFPCQWNRSGRIHRSILVIRFRSQLHHLPVETRSSQLCQKVDKIAKALLLWYRTSLFVIGYGWCNTDLHPFSKRWFVVDLLISEKGHQKAYEIKSGATYSSDYFKGIKVWAKLSGAKTENCHVIYNGDRHFTTSFGEVIPWQWGYHDESSVRLEEDYDLLRDTEARSDISNNKPGSKIAPNPGVIFFLSHRSVQPCQSSHSLSRLGLKLLGEVTYLPTTNKPFQLDSQVTTYS